MIERADMWEYLGVSPDDEFEDEGKCWHEFSDGDLPDRSTDRCLHCERTAQELGIPIHEEKE